MNVNVRALAEMTSMFLPAMLERGSGRILNVGSVAGFRAVPGMSVYSASKAFVLSFTESLAEELVGTGVSVTAFCPGLTKTDMVESEGGVELPDFMMADPRQVAEDGYAACMRGEVVAVPGAMNQALVAWLASQPRWLTRIMSGAVARASMFAR